MSIRLRELFACTEQGGAFVAESADGRLLHIGEVPSGLACNCVCPGCGRRMVAKKGDVQALEKGVLELLRQYRDLGENVSGGLSL